MHQSCYNGMEHLVQTYAKSDGTENVIDIGSFDVNGTLSPLFVPDVVPGEKWEIKPSGWTGNFKSYLGIDLVEGPNVSMLMSENSIPVKDDSFDIAVSANTLEHVKFFWEWSKEVHRIVKPGGLIFFHVVGRFVQEHRYPVDCWRFMNDGMKVILEDWLNMELLYSEDFGIDVFGVGRK